MIPGCSRHSLRMDIITYGESLFWCFTLILHHGDSMKKILIIGAGFLQDFVIVKAKQLGYTVVTVDADEKAPGFAHADGHAVISITDEKACLEYAKKEKIDGVLTAATDFGVMTTAYIAESMGLPGLSYEAARLVKNKYRVRKRLFECGADDSGPSFEADAESDLRALGRILAYPVMVKPCDGSGSRGAGRVDSEEALADAVSFAIASSLSKRAEIEPFVDGKEYGAESIVTADGEIHVLAVMKKRMTKPPYYAELGHTVPCGLPAEQEDKIRRIVKKAIRALGIGFGCVNMDMLVTEDGRVCIVDIGARMGGNMIGPCVVPYGTGIDYMAATIRNAVGDEVNLHEDAHDAVATRLLAFSEGTIVQLPDFRRIEEDYGVEIVHHMHEGMRVNEYHTNLDGCGYIVAKAADADEANIKAERALNYIRDHYFVAKGAADLAAGAENV